MSQTFVRLLEIESLKTTLEMQQKFVGDVSCVIWDAGLVLSKYIEILCNQNKDYLKSKSIIELGAGLGCVGLVASCFGAKVIMTDLPEAVDNLWNNIDHNKSVWQMFGGSAEVKPLKWGSEDVLLFSAPDIIIASDCVYYKESIKPLVDTMAALCKSDTEVFVCQEERETDKQKQAWALFLELFNQHFDYNKIPIKDQHELYSCEEITILRGKKRS